MKTDIRRDLAIFIVVASLGVGATRASAAHHEIQVGGNNNAFAPTNTDVRIGDTVTFSNAGGEHNVASTAGAAFAFRCAQDCGSNGGVSNTAWSFTLTIPPEAAHHTIEFFCERHGLGMAGTLSVTNPVSLQSFDID